MAIRARDYGGFSSGFAQGFGLVRDLQDSRARMDIAQEELDMNRAYREGVIEDRRRQRELDEKQYEVLGDIRKTQAETTLLNAQTANLRAQTAAQEAENRSTQFNEDGTEKVTAVEQAQIERLGAQRDQAEAAQDLSEYNLAKLQKEELNIKNAKLINDMMILAKDGSDASYSQLQSMLENNSKSLFDPRSEFNLMDRLNPELQDNAAKAVEVLGQFTDPNAQPIEGFLEPEVLAAVSETIGTQRAQYIGKTINPPTTNAAGVSTPSNFPNAPSYMHGGTVINSGIIDIQQTLNDQGQLVMTMTAANEVQLPNGDTHMYFPPITSGRGTQGSAPVQVPVDDGMKAFFGSSLSAQYMQSDPVFRREAERQNKIENFGSIAKFDQAVESEVNSIMSAIQEADKTLDAGDVLGDRYDINTGGKTVGQLIDDRRFVENEVRQKNLYGASKVTYLKRAQNVADALRTEVPGYSIDTTGRRKTGRSGRPGGLGVSTTLAGIINKDMQSLPLNVLAHIDGFFEDGELMGATAQEKKANYEKLTDYLRTNNLLKP